MPRYYMNICNGEGYVENGEGVDLADEAAARATAIAGARGLMASEIQKGELDLTSFIEVEDSQHKSLFRLTFADAIKVQSGPTRDRPDPA